MSLDKNHSFVARLAKRVKTHPLVAVIVGFLVVGAFGAGLKYLDEDAQRQKALKPKDRSMLSKVNPFLAAPSPTPTPQLSREYIYAESRLLTVQDANANAAPPADLAVWRPTNGTWYVMGGTGSQQVTQGWGISGDEPVEGDYDGDGKTDFSVFRPSESKWYIFYSSTSTSSEQEWGITGDLAAQADYDGDGKTDMAIYRPNDSGTNLSKWYMLQSSNGYVVGQFGLPNDKPVPHDYDGDGKADLAVWRNSNTNFYSVNSTDSSQHTYEFSNSGTPVGADYDGDGKADFAVFSPGTTYGYWFIRNSTTGTIPTTGIEFGLAADTPVQNDYDGDGKCDVAVWRSGSLAYWHIRQSAWSFSTRTEQWGIAGDIPVPAYFRR